MTSLVVLLSCLFGCSVSVEFPNPQREWRMCGRTKPSYICDPDFILERGDVERLDQMAHEFRRSTSCMCPKCTDSTGISVGIFLKQNISQAALTKYPTGKDLSEMLRRRWSLSTCDSDIVIVLVAQMNITGYSLGPPVQPLLPSATADQVLADCAAHFESGFHYQGLESVLNSFEDVIMMAQRQGPRTFKNLVLGIGLGFGVMLALAVLALVMLHRQQLMRRKSNCEDIFQTSPRNNNRRPSFNQERHLDKLKCLNSIDEDDFDDETTPGDEEFARSHPSDVRSTVKFMRMYRQLSDVTEESGEDDLSKRNSSAQASFSSSYCSPKGSVPVTEL